MNIYNDCTIQELQNLNIKAYDYFRIVENKKNLNFRKWHVFHELYKTESFIYYMENFLIINMPCIARILFNIRRKFLSVR